MPAAQTIPLFAAAAIAYERVFSTRRTEGLAPSVDELGISDEELMRGMFWGGAMRFELTDAGPAVTRLSVRKADLERVLAELGRNPPFA